MLVYGCGGVDCGGGTVSDGLFWLKYK